MDVNFEDQVRQRAYQIWVNLGRAEGQAHDHWIAAERDLIAQSTKPAPRAAEKDTKAAPKAKSAKSATVEAASTKAATPKNPAAPKNAAAAKNAASKKATMSKQTAMSKKASTEPAGVSA